MGVNNHFQSIILTGVLVRDEKVETFEWVFAEFIMMMGGAAPQTILPGNNLWLFAQLMISQHVVYSKKIDFCAEFHKVVNHMLTIDAFEKAWKFLVEKYKLKNNAYMTQLYEIRHKWTKSYFTGVFCA